MLKDLDVEVSSKNVDRIIDVLDSDKNGDYYFAHT